MLDVLGEDLLLLAGDEIPHMPGGHRLEVRQVDAAVAAEEMVALMLLTILGCKGLDRHRHLLLNHGVDLE